jgi:murein DD-endopeptidase MepM/ murein hydrolase activator NlpD
MVIKDFKKLLLSLTAAALLSNFPIAHAQSIDELRSKISEKNDQIKQLDEEIKKYQGEINKVGQEAQTLQGAIQVLDINQKKIQTEIKKTLTNIDKTNLSISELEKEIGVTNGKIGTNSEAVAKTLSEISRVDDVSLVEMILSGKNISDVWNEVETMKNFQESVREHTAELGVYKDNLEGKKTEVESKKKELTVLKTGLDDQNKVLANNKKEKSTLLTQTKNKESEYKKILAEKQTQKEQFEKDLFRFESELKIKIDPNSFPSGRKGIIDWPIDNPLLTQQFGRTSDAKRLYSSGTHNGIDLRAARGTPIKSVLSGTVQATGNTDAQYGCYSYGKWVLVKHENGLTSLYAHLDLIKVSSGQSVATGEVIGYSGQTGYATGPHLHLTIYASQGVRVQQYTSSINCKNVTIPIAPADAYLDPMVYLPQL